MKYMLFRSLGTLDEQVELHSLVAVEYGDDIFDVTPALIRAVNDELSNSPEYAKCQTWADEPEEISEEKLAGLYDYIMMGVVSPPNAPENILIEFGIVEANEDP